MASSRLRDLLYVLISVGSGFAFGQGREPSSAWVEIITEVAQVAKGNKIPRTDLPSTGMAIPG